MEPLPIRLSAQPLVLKPMAVLLLGRQEIGEDPPPQYAVTHGDGGSGTFREIAAPDEMVASPAVRGFAPGDGEAGGQGPGEGLVLVDLQHHRRGSVNLPLESCQSRRKAKSLLPRFP